MKAFLSSDMGCYELTPVNKKIAARLQEETGNESVLFQSDWDRPGALMERLTALSVAKRLLISSRPQPIGLMPGLETFSGLAVNTLESDKQLSKV